MSVKLKKSLSILLSVLLLITAVVIPITATETVDEATTVDYYVQSPGYAALNSGEYSKGDGTKNNPAASVADLVSIIGDSLTANDTANVYIMQREDWNVYYPEGTSEDDTSILVGKVNGVSQVPYHSMTSWVHTAAANPSSVAPASHSYKMVIKAYRESDADTGKVYLAYADQLGCNGYLYLGGPTVFEDVTLVSQRTIQQPVITKGYDLTFEENCTFGYLNGLDYSTSSTKSWNGTVTAKDFTYFMGYRTTATAINGFDLTINNAFSITNTNYAKKAFYFPSNYGSSKSATVSGDVNITIDNQNAVIPFIWATGKAAATYTFENINIKVKSATTLTNAAGTGSVAINGGLQVIIPSDLTFDMTSATNVTATDTDGDETDETTLSNKLWILKNASSNEDLITFATDNYGNTITGKFAVAEDCDVLATSAKDESVVYSSDESGILDLSAVPGEYIITSVTKRYDYYVAHGGTGDGTDIDNPAPSVAAAVTTMNEIGGLLANDTANIWIMQDIEAVANIEETVSSGGKTYNQHNLAYWGSVPSHTAKISVKPYANNQTNNVDANLPTYLAVVNTVGNNSQINFTGPTEIDDIKIVYCSRSNLGNQGDGRINFNGNSVKLGSGVSYCYTPVNSDESTTWDGALTDLTSLTADITTGSTTEKIHSKPFKVEIAHSVTADSGKGGYFYLPAYSAAYNTFEKDVTLAFTGAVSTGRLKIGESTNTYPVTFKQNLNVKITEAGGGWRILNGGNIIVEGGVQLIVSDKATTNGSDYPFSTIYAKAYTDTTYETTITNHWILNVNDAMVEAIDFVENEKGKFQVPEFHTAVATNVADTTLTYSSDENGVLDLSAVPGEYTVVVKQLEQESDTYKDYINYRGYNADITNYNGALANTFKKLSSDTALNVVYMGGSTLNDASLRTEIGAWLQTNFPNVTINNVDKSIAETGTTFGALRVSRDVLSKTPDLLFIEYSLDDYLDGISSKKSLLQFETIVREVKEVYPDCDIVTLFASTSEMGNELYSQALAQEEICEKYNISSINIGSKSELYYDIIKEFLANTLLFGEYGTGYEITEQTLPEMTSKYLLDGNNSFIFPVETEYTTSGGSSYDDEAQAFGVADYVGVITVPAGSNDTITVNFEGTELAMLTNEGNGVSNAYQVSIDSGEFVSAQYGDSILTVIASGLVSGEHTAVIKPALYSQVGVCGFYTRDMEKVTNNLNICDLVYLDKNYASNTTLDYNNDQAVDTKDISALKKILLSNWVEPALYSTAHITPIARLGWRPYTGNLPQQSLMSYQKAYESGHRILLCDIRLTSDGYMVCCHDDDISKVSAYDANGVAVKSGEVLISTTTLSDLLTYDFGAYKKYNGLQILQPEDFLKLCAQYDDVTPVFETKVIDDENQAKLVALIKEYGFENNVMFVSGTDRARSLGAALPNSVIGRWVYTLTDGIISDVETYGSAGKFIYVAKDGGNEDSINFENYVKCKAKGIDIGFTYIGSSTKSYFDDLKNQGIFNYCKYIALDEVSWLYE